MEDVQLWTEICDGLRVSGAVTAFDRRSYREDGESHIWRVNKNWLGERWGTEETFLGRWALVHVPLSGGTQLSPGTDKCQWRTERRSGAGKGPDFERLGKGSISCGPVAHAKYSSLDLKDTEMSFECSTQNRTDGSLKNELERIKWDLGGWGTAGLKPGEECWWLEPGW